MFKIQIDNKTRVYNCDSILIMMIKIQNNVKIEFPAACDSILIMMFKIENDV